MLVLSRHKDESIMIGDDVVVTIVDIRGDKVRLGIDAPTEIPIHRQEVYDAIQRENRKENMRTQDNEKYYRIYNNFEDVVQPYDSIHKLNKSYERFPMNYLS